MTKFTASLLAASLALVALPAFAADLPVKAAAAPAAPAPTTTLALEVSPEFVAASGATQNNIADWYAKGTVSYAVAPGWTVAAAVQDTIKPATSAFNGLYQYQIEASAAYKFKLNDQFSVTGTAGLGLTGGNTGYAGGIYTGGAGAVDLGNSDDTFGYYFVQAALDYKLDSHWTWNVIQARYRNAFNETWITPKIATGVTYNIDATDAVYFSLGYAWKDKGNGAGLVADK